MKNKSLFLLLFAMSISIVYGQKATRENVLLEIGTGTWCTYCPGAAMGADDLIANGHDVAVIENHNGDAFDNTYSNARNSYYNIGSWPTAKFDGVLTVAGGSHTQSMYGSYLPKVNQRLAVSSNFTMAMSGYSEDMLNCEVVVDVDKVGGSYGNLRLHVAVTESDISYNWQGQNELNFVNRLMSPDQNGTTLNFSSQNSHQVTLNFTINGSWDFEHCEVVAFLQNNSTKEVYQTIKLSMNDFSFGLAAGFSADIQEVVKGHSVTYSDLSDGDPTSWFWEFEGGAPATFSGQNPPPVFYNTLGVYDVSLTVSDGIDNSTETKTDYITVIARCPASGGADFLRISNVTIGDIDNSTGQSLYEDYTYLSTNLSQGDENVEISISNTQPNDGDDLGIWADWNQDGDFDDTNEQIVCEVSLGWSGTGNGTFSFDVPETAMLGSTIMRVRLKYLGDICGQSCGPTNYGEVEDYTLQIIAQISPPVADFAADDLAPDVDQTVTFTDLSTNSPNIWNWAFNPTTITYMNGTNASSQNPEVSFSVPGYYTVSLTASNDGGSDQEVKLNYIFVEDPILVIDTRCILEGFYNGLGMGTGINNILPLYQPYNQSPWNYSGGESVTVMSTDIVDWVIVELRDAFTPLLATSATSIGMQAALLRSDGKIVGMDGTSLLEFDASYGNNLFLIIHYKNNLSVISSIGLAESAGIYEYDFSDGSTKAYGGIDAQNQLGTNVWGLISGDANANGTVDIDDINPLWKNSSGIHDYHNCDFNGDGEINNIDKDDFWFRNQNKSTFVPN